MAPDRSALACLGLGLLLGTCWSCASTRSRCAGQALPVGCALQGVQNAHICQNWGRLLKKKQLPNIEISSPLACELDSMLFSCSLSLSKFLCRRLEYWSVYAWPFGHFWPSLGGLGRVTIYGNGPKLGSLGLEVFGYDGRHLYE